MSQYDAVICKTLREDFNVIWKRVEPYVQRRNLTKDKNKIQQYINDLVETFNKISRYYARIYRSQNLETQNTLKELWTNNFQKIYRAFQILHANYTFKNNYFEQIDLSLIQISEEQSEARTTETASSDNSESEDNLTDKSGVQKVEQNSGTEDTTEHETNARTEDQQPQPSVSGTGAVESNNSEQNLSNLSLNSEILEEPATMPQTKTEFMRLAGPILNYKYDGEPLKLNTFITDVELVTEMAETEQTDLCFKFIKSKLEGRALEAMPETYTTVAEITKALKEKIKPDSSKVIAGKISSLRLIKGNYTSFAKQAEELAESLRRSLVNEGMTKAKAEEMAIEETQKLCRKSTNVDLVRSAVTIGVFSSPAEVIAKFITESDTTRLEYQQKQSKQQNKNQGGNKPFNKGKKGHFQNNQQNNQQQNKNGGKNTFYNSNFKGNKPKFQNQRTETIRLVQGNPQSPPEGGASSSNAQGMVYQFTPHHN